MISVRQIKAGRSMLNWSAADLAKASRVGPATIRRDLGIFGNNRPG